MPFILRKIRKSRWYGREDFPWLVEGELQADALGDLQTSNNKLSAWQVEDDKSNLERIITALAANCDNISNFDYVLFDINVLPELRIQIESSKADTPDEKANISWHYDLIELSAQKLVKLAEAIMTKGERDRRSEKRICQLIIQGVVSGQINQTRLKQDVQAKIDKMGFQT